jgi:POT family proton-dependent oligopeptide transporter
LWRRQALRGAAPDELAKIRVGAWLAAASNLILVVAVLTSGNKLINPLWPFMYSVGVGVAFVHYWPTLLGLVSRVAPAKMNATMMGVALMSLFISNNLIGWIGRFYEAMPPAEFWALHAAIAATGATLMTLFGKRLSRALNRT